MKTKIILGSLLLMLTAGNSFSQADSRESNAYTLAIVKDAGSNFIGKTTADPSSLVSVKVKKMFDKNFLGATGLRWEVNGKDLEAIFWKDKLLTYALFKKSGSLNFSVAFVPEQKLPADLTQMVKSKYSDYAITFAAEAKFSNRKIWILNLENEKQILTLTSEDDNLELVQTAKKASTAIQNFFIQ
jgi:hypothetical protein